MSTQEVRKFYEQVGKSEMLREEIAKIDAGLKGKQIQPIDLANIAKEKIIPLAKNNGYNFSESDLFSYFEEKLKVLDIEDLDQISGGISQRTAGIGLGAIMLLGLGGTAAMNIMKGQPDNGGTSISQSAPQDTQKSHAKEKRAEAYPGSKTNKANENRRNVRNAPGLGVEKAEKIERIRPKTATNRTLEGGPDLDAQSGRSISTNRVAKQAKQPTQSNVQINPTSKSNSANSIGNSSPQGASTQKAKNVNTAGNSSPQGTPTQKDRKSAGSTGERDYKVKNIEKEHLGASPEAPEAPETLETPEAPKAPETLEVPETPNVPELTTESDDKKEKQESLDETQGKQKESLVDFGKANEQLQVFNLSMKGINSRLSVNALSETISEYSNLQKELKEKLRSLENQQTSLSRKDYKEANMVIKNYKNTLHQVEKNLKMLKGQESNVERVARLREERSELLKEHSNYREKANKSLDEIQKMINLSNNLVKNANQRSGIYESLIKQFGKMDGYQDGTDRDLVEVVNNEKDTFANYTEVNKKQKTSLQKQKKEEQTQQKAAQSKQKEEQKQKATRRKKTEEQSKKKAAQKQGEIDLGIEDGHDKKLPEDLESAWNLYEEYNSKYMKILERAAADRKNIKNIDLREINSVRDGLNKAKQAINKAIGDNSSMDGSHRVWGEDILKEIREDLGELSRLEKTAREQKATAEKATAGKGTPETSKERTVRKKQATAERTTAGKGTPETNTEETARKQKATAEKAIPGTGTPETSPEKTVRKQKATAEKATPGTGTPEQKQYDNGLGFNAGNLSFKNTVGTGTPETSPEKTVRKKQATAERTTAGKGTPETSKERTLLSKLKGFLPSAETLKKVAKGAVEGAIGVAGLIGTVYGLAAIAKSQMESGVNNGRGDLELSNEKDFKTAIDNVNGIINKDSDLTEEQKQAFSGIANNLELSPDGNNIVMNVDAFESLTNQCLPNSDVAMGDEQFRELINNTNAFMSNEDTIAVLDVSDAGKYNINDAAEDITEIATNGASVALDLYNGGNKSQNEGTLTLSDVLKGWQATATERSTENAMEDIVARLAYQGEIGPYTDDENNNSENQYREPSNVAPTDGMGNGDNQADMGQTPNEKEISNQYLLGGLDNGAPTGGTANGDNQAEMDQTLRPGTQTEEYFNGVPTGGTANGDSQADMDQTPNEKEISNQYLLGGLDNGAPTGGTANGDNQKKK